MSELDGLKLLKRIEEGAAGKTGGAFSLARARSVSCSRSTGRGASCD
jgi:hypothetical protein